MVIIVIIFMFTITITATITITIITITITATITIITSMSCARPSAKWVALIKPSSNSAFHDGHGHYNGDDQLVRKKSHL